MSHQPSTAIQFCESESSMFRMPERPPEIPVVYSDNTNQDEEGLLAIQQIGNLVFESLDRYPLEVQ